MAGASGAQRTADVVIVGGAAVGSATAYFLTRLGFKGSVVVVEKDPTYEFAATSRSLASFRRQFTTPESIRLSEFGYRFCTGQEQGASPEVDWRPFPYLSLASDKGREEMVHAVAAQRAEGAGTTLLDPDELKARYPWISTEGVAVAALGGQGEGRVDPHLLLGFMKQGAQTGGVTYVADEVTKIEVVNGRARRVMLKGGGEISAGTVVVAAGWRTATLTQAAGLDLPVRPRKRLVFVLDVEDELPDMGLLIDYSGVYIRREGRYYLSGLSPTVDPDCPDFNIEHEFFDNEMWPLLAGRVPALERLKVVRAWACHYDYMTLDQNAIIGPLPIAENLLVACGLSGHGLQHSPGVGRGLAELIVQGRYTSIDLGRYGYERIPANRPLLEANVI